LGKLLFILEGRVNRAKYWLVLVGIVLVESVVVGVTGAADFLTDDVTAVDGKGAIHFLAFVIFLPLLWIGFVANVKRWHDRNKSGWWILINHLPVIGWLWILIECGFQRGTVGPNRFGQDPLRQR
jgi:uncharacterized membrane protein YhaH (DUF805 family)